MVLTPQRIIALVVAFFTILLLVFSKKIAAKILEKKYPDKKPEDEYNNKLLSVTLFYKSIAAALAVAACVLSLL